MPVRTALQATFPGCPGPSLGSVSAVTVVQGKSDQRAQARRRRRSLSASERESASSAIATRLTELLSGAGTVSSYVAIRDEPDLSALNQALVGEGRLVLPCILDGALVMVRIDAATEFVESAFGVPEPHGESVDPATIDVVLVPGLAFDADGARMGYGAGYYDRFLAVLPAATQFVGVCFEVSIVDRVLTESHDVRMHRVVTELVDRLGAP